jgi:high-affinity Fe2+/Pb2+ permease
VASVMITAQQDKDAQAAAAAADDDDDDAATQDDSLTQRDRRRRYKQWVWGGRVGFLLACLQVVGAAYLTHVIVEKEYANIHHSRQPNSFS